MKIQRLNEWIQVNAPKYTTTSTNDIDINLKSVPKKIIATNETICKIVKNAIKEYGNDADLNFIDISKVTNLSDLFYQPSCRNFNGDISKWDVSNVTDMRSMFSNSKFNGDISNWNVSNVIIMRGMFNDSEFNGDISKWDVSNVTDMSYMFYGCKQFNSDISKWDVSNVTDMSFMFVKSNFNSDISKWDVSNVKNMNNMFAHSIFNGDISQWNVSNCHNFNAMFAFSKFNGDLSNWNMKSAESLCYMFINSKFDGDISNWKIDFDKIVKRFGNVGDNIKDMFTNSPLENNLPNWYPQFNYEFNLKETENIPENCIDFVKEDVYNFNERYYNAIIKGVESHAEKNSLKKQDYDLFNDILDSVNAWLDDNDAGYHVRPSDISEVFTIDMLNIK